MTDVAEHLKAGLSGLTLDETLQKPVSALLGVSDEAATALQRVGISSIFELGSSWLFAHASAAIAARDIAEPAPAPLLEDVAQVPADQIPGLPLRHLRGLSDEDATAISQALDVQSLREFALWPPRHIAQRLLSMASGADGEVEDVHAEALRPRLGEYPTERVYYESLVMLGMATDASQQPLTGTIPLQPVIDDPVGFGQPAVGALVTLSQSWFAKGITLGHMLHSLALAPGEATRIAVVDWSRRTRSTSTESIDESERLDSATEHSRAISEVQNAVAGEMQSGGSMTSGWAKSTTKGKAGGWSVGGGLAGAFKGVSGVLGFGGGSGSSSSESVTESEASSTSWSIGNRSVTAQMAQHANERTEQHSASVRNRRASAVREVSQSEHEEVSTRVVANYNHMHALTVQYYEVVQVYRVVVRVKSVQRVLFLPFELLDFSAANAGDAVARFRGSLLGAALNPRIAALLLDDRGEVEVRTAARVPLPIVFSEIAPASLVATAHLARVIEGTATSTPTAPATGGTTAGGSVLTAPAPATPLVVRRITRPGPLAGVVPGDVVVAAVSFDGVGADRVRFDQPGVPGDDSTFAVPATTFRVDFPNGLLLRNVTGIHVAKTGADADAGTMTLHVRSGAETLELPIALDLAAGTAMQKVAYVAADPANRKEELLAHLQANRTHYSQAVLRNLDSATLVMLMSRFSWKGRPLTDQVEPKPLAVAGNYLVLRAPVAMDEDAGVDDSGMKWSELLLQRELKLDQQDDRLVPIPTGGVFAEAVLGRSNSAEKLDITRFWNWQDSPIPLQPPEIAPVATGSRGTTEDLKPGQLGAPVLNVLTPTTLPEPAGLSAALNTLASASLFRDMSGLAGTQALAQASTTGTLDAATEAGRQASANYKTAADQAVAMGQAAADMWKVAQQTKQGGGGGGGAAGGGSDSNISADGARINHGRDMDQRGVSAGSNGLRVTESQAEFQAAGGGGGGGGSGGGSGGGEAGGMAPISRELAFADTSATGISPALLTGTTQALGGGAVAGALAGMVLPSAAVHAALQTLVFSHLRADAQASGASLQNVRLHPMKAHRYGARFSAIGLFAWTNSSSDIYFDVDAYLAGISEHERNGATNDEAVQLMRGFGVIVLRHELVHIDQFRQTGRPTSFKQMVTYEREALGCSGATARPLASLPWLANTGSGGATDFLVNTLKLDAADAASMVTDAQNQMTASCSNLAPLVNLTQAKQIMDGLINHQFLPEELVNGKGRTYAVADLYR
ncbi:hypothetical protein [Lysobacter sp.]|uniref:hypothetical protein n=1 Tax=Lysobacter sp. TaxID=72226 RepID=UPI002D5B9F90|nr:hypothetical protein [Lysobacter sp.]HZX76072.1 hypothetical protein [Lysobacter sp.]